MERRRLVGQLDQLRGAGVGRGGVEEVNESHGGQDAAAAPGTGRHGHGVEVADHGQERGGLVVIEGDLGQFPVEKGQPAAVRLWLLVDYHGRTVVRDCQDGGLNLSVGE